MKTAVIYFAIVFLAAVLIGDIWQRLGLASQVKDIMIKKIAAVQSQQ